MINLKLHLKSIHECFYTIIIHVILCSGIQGLSLLGKSAKLQIDSNQASGQKCLTHS